MKTDPFDPKYDWSKAVSIKGGAFMEVVDATISASPDWMLDQTHLFNKPKVSYLRATAKFNWGKPVVKRKKRGA